VGLQRVVLGVEEEVFLEGECSLMRLVEGVVVGGHRG